MKKIMFLLLSTCLFTNALAYNSGASCITFLSKNGTLEVKESEKFKKSDLEAVIKYYTSKDKGKTPKVTTSTIRYASGLAKNQKLYDAKIIDRYNYLYFQNGIFYYKRAQDFITFEMEDLSKVIGGKVEVKCILIDEPVEE